MAYSAELGRIGWIDLTVGNADDVSSFYEAVIGWKRNPHPMGDYNDYDMRVDDEAVVGICNALKENAGIPPQWLMYVNVASVKESSEIAKARGGTIVEGPRMMGGYHFCIVQDPAGAVLALMSPES